MKPANVLDLPTLTEDWWDKDIVLVHAAFTLLEKFVDEEWDGLEAHRASLRRMRDRKSEEVSVWVEGALSRFEIVRELYEYWQERKKKKEPHGLQVAQYKKDTEMLHKLIDIRAELWI